MILVLTLILLASQAQAIDCSNTTSRYQKSQCSRVANYNKTPTIPASSNSTTSSSKNTFKAPAFTAGIEQDEVAAHTDQPSSITYTPGQQYQHTTVHPPQKTKPAKSYFTPF
ncbi:MAG TPA: hypothetical protein QF353_03495 [Gammaproteobacteria bacterium]|nr:hypothetical protein [Gammaproteobacteria bacterium]